ncbi:MAG: cupredoxin domain-containing protein [Actinomycetota bacterium]
MQQSRPDLSGEIRFRVPLVLVIPLGAVVVIAALTWSFSRILLSLPAGAATTVAILTAANILGACTFLALRPSLPRATVFEVVLVALYPVIIGLVMVQAGFGVTEEAGASEGGGEQSVPAGPATDSIVAEGTEFNADEIELAAKKPTDFEIENRDAVIHNLLIYQTEADAADPNNSLFKSPDIAAGATDSFPIKPLKKGDYYFVCAYHANMNGTVKVG